MSWKALFAAWLAVVVVSIALTAGAQSTVGSIYGTVTDPSGAAIPSAAVSVKEVHTGVTQNGVTSGKGEYVFPTINPGDYAVTVTASGSSRRPRPALPSMPTSTFTFPSPCRSVGPASRWRWKPV